MTNQRNERETKREKRKKIRWLRIGNGAQNIQCRSKKVMHGIRSRGMEYQGPHRNARGTAGTSNQGGRRNLCTTPVCATLPPWRIGSAGTWHLQVTGGSQLTRSTHEALFLAASCPHEALKRCGRLGERLTDMKRDRDGGDASLAPLGLLGRSPLGSVLEMR